jgi:hypothetical protein
VTWKTALKSGNDLLALGERIRLIGAFGASFSDPKRFSLSVMQKTLEFMESRLGLDCTVFVFYAVNSRSYMGVPILHPLRQARRLRQALRLRTKTEGE